MKILLPAGPYETLLWSRETELAKKTSEKITWEFDLQIELPLDDPTQFHSRALAMETFSKNLYPELQERSEAIVLYRGPIDWSGRFSWDARQRELFEDWKKERPNAPEEHLKRLFYADRLVLALQMLSHKLPDELPILLEFEEPKHLRRVERKQLLSKERFEHFFLPQKEKEGPFALCFPEESFCSGEVLQDLEKFLEEIPSNCRLVEERFLTEEWEGIDTLFVLSSALSPRGKRKLAGFLATGGELFVKGDALGLEGEKEFRGRGI